MRIRYLGTTVFRPVGFSRCNQKGCQRVAGGHSEAETSGAYSRIPHALRKSARHWSGCRPGRWHYHGMRRRGRAVAASPPHMKDQGLHKSMKIKGGMNASENFCADRFETDGAETQLSPTTTPVGDSPMERAFSPLLLADDIPRPLAWAGMAAGLWPSDLQRQRRAAIPARGNAPGIATMKPHKG
jgi:hypothetical protein